MKANYFYQPRADADDAALQRAVLAQYVPASCLLGGALVMAAASLGQDPCATCPGPRMQCGGRAFGGTRPTAPIAQHYRQERGKGQQYFFLGVDSAPSESQRSDDGALVGAVAQPKRIPHPSGDGENQMLSPLVADWNFDFIYGKRLTSKERASARQYSGVIHRLHQRLGFEGIMMDPGGGGQWIQRELKNYKQIIDGTETKVVPIADKLTGPYELTAGYFILNLYKRGDPGVEQLWPGLAGDDMLNDSAYSILKEGLDTGVINLPAPAREWFGDAEKKVAIKKWTEERTWCIKNLDALADQLVKIVVLTKEDGTQVLTRRHARQFEARGKKDLASAAMYCYLSFLIWLRSEEWQEAVPQKEKSQFSAW